MHVSMIMVGLKYLCPDQCAASGHNAFLLLFLSHHILYIQQHSSDGKESLAGTQCLAAHLANICSRRNGCAGIRDIILGAGRCRARVQAQVSESSDNGPDSGNAREFSCEGYLLSDLYL